MELFAQPIRWLKTNKTNESERAVTERALHNMGSSSYIMTDKEDELQLVQNPSSGSAWESYTCLEDRCKKAITAVILGHEDCMSGTPGKLGAQQGYEYSAVNSALKEVENEQDKWVSSVINDNVIPKLRSLGFNIPNDVSFGYLNNVELSEISALENKRKNDFATVIETLTRAGYEVDEKFVAAQTGIPVRRR